MPVTINGTTGVVFPAGGSGNPAGTVVGTTDTQTLTNKTLSGSLVNEPSPVTLASAATVNIGAAASNTINISGTTTITAFDTVAAGAIRRLIFAGALTLTYNATSLILPGSASITTAAGDVAEFVSLGSGNWKCFNYAKASGAAVATSGVSGFNNMVVLGTGSSTWTIPAGITAIKVTVTAGGNSGGNGGSNGCSSAGGGGGGGGAGGSSVKYFTGLTPGNTLSYTVGAAGGASSLSSGTQTITTISATAGSAGTTSTGSAPGPGGAGGLGSGGTLNIRGGNGATGTYGNLSNLTVGSGGAGGNSMFGAGGGSGVGGAFGGGGAGGTAPIGAGSAGAAGTIVIEY